MDFRKRFIIYPLDDQSFAVYKALRSKGVDVTGVSALGSGYVGKTVANLVNRKEPSELIESINHIDFDKQDAILISSSISYELNKDDLQYICTSLKNRNLEVYYYGEDENIINMFKQFNISYCKEPLDNLIANQVKAFKRSGKYNQFKIKVPAVYIGGLIESYDSLDIALQLKHEFEQREFICSLVSNNPNAKIAGAVGYPLSFMGTDISPHEQIVEFNQWVSSLDYLVKPDIVLFDVPKGIMQYSNKIHNTFGIYTYMMHQTIPSDFLIVTLPADCVKTEIVEKTSIYFKRLLGRSPDLYHISNVLHNVGAEPSMFVDKPLYIKENQANDILENEIDKLCETRIEDVIYQKSAGRITDLLIETYRRDNNG